MQTIYVAGIELWIQGDLRFQAIASFLDRSAAEAFVRAENDAVQADMLVISKNPLVDDFGFLMSPREFPGLRTEVFAALATSYFDEI